MSTTNESGDRRGHLHLAVALDGAGWHPAAWREADARPGDLFTPQYWIDLAATAERGLLDFLTIEDSLALQSADPLTADDRTDQVRGRLDAVEIAARVAPTTRSIGFVPTAVTTHTEPFHLSKAIATLDYVSAGRAGLRVQVAAQDHVNRNFGRRELPPVEFPFPTDEITELERVLFGEATDYVEVLRRLWDSWEDDAEIRDVATGRFVDSAKLHYIDFAGEYFAVKGPSITPRPPQGQPLVAALAHRDRGFALIGESADIGFITPHSQDEARSIVAAVDAAATAAGRRADEIHLFGDLVVFLDETAQAADDRLGRLNEVSGVEYTSDAQIFTGTASELADLLIERRDAGLSGFRLRPGTLPTDLAAIADDLVPELGRRGVFRTGYPEQSTLRGLLGLGRPANRYATR